MLEHLYSGKPLNLAHRGALWQAPENTLASLRRALQLGADGFEFDAKLTRDGVPILMHDATVERTTDGEGKVAGLTLAEIKALDAGSWFDVEFRGEPVPTLEEVFAEFGERAIMNVELTNYTTPGDGLEARVVEMIRRHDLARRVILSSFNPFSIRRVKRLDPALPTAILTMRDLPIYLRRVWLAPLAPHEARHPHRDEVNEAYLRAIRRKGLRVHCWSSAEEDDTLEGISRLIALGVDGLICNQPEVVNKAMGRARRSRSQKRG